MKFSLKGYIRYVRKQHVHVQRLHALFFAGGICLLLGIAILYTGYGYWHEEYSKDQQLYLEKQNENNYIGAVSPLERMAELFKEGKDRLSNITSSFGGGSTYQRNATSTP